MLSNEILHYVLKTCEYLTKMWDNWKKSEQEVLLKKHESVSSKIQFMRILKKPIKKNHILFISNYDYISVSNEYKILKLNTN